MLPDVCKGVPEEPCARRANMCKPLEWKCQLKLECELMKCWWNTSV